MIISSLTKKRCQYLYKYKTYIAHPKLILNSHGPS